MTEWRTLMLAERDDRVVVTLDDPERGNALGQQMIDELHLVFDGLEREPGRGRVLVITGAGGLFAAGADIRQLRERDRDDALAGINLRLFERLRATPMPTVAAVDGYALGGGAELAYAADIRVATHRAVFGQPESSLGIMAAAGGCFRLAELVGEGLARDILFTGRQLSAAEALSSGLVTRLVEPEALMESAHEIVDHIHRSSPLALRLTKLALNAGPAAHPAIELTAQAVLFEDGEKRARMDAFLARRRKRAGGAV